MKTRSARSPPPGLGAAEDERELRDHAVLAAAARRLEGVLDARALLHLAPAPRRSPPRPRCRPCAAAAADELPGARRRSRPGCRPARSTTRAVDLTQRLQDRDARLFAVEEVVVVELHRVRAPAVAQGAHGRVELRRLQPRHAVEHGHHAAELTAIAAADGRLVDRGAHPHEARPQVAPHVAHPLVGQGGNSGRAEVAVRVVLRPPRRASRSAAMSAQHCSASAPRPAVLGAGRHRASAQGARARVCSPCPRTT